MKNGLINGVWDVDIRPSVEVTLYFSTIGMLSSCSCDSFELSSNVAAFFFLDTNLSMSMTLIAAFPESQTKMRFLYRQRPDGS